ncbi:hypothetical protein JOM56_004629 [Amanita muscaria]
MGNFFFPLASFQLSLTLPLLHVLSSTVQPMRKKAHWVPLPHSNRISQPSMFTIVSTFSYPTFQGLDGLSTLALCNLNSLLSVTTRITPKNSTFRLNSSCSGVIQSSTRARAQRGTVMCELLRGEESTLLPLGVALPSISTSSAFCAAPIVALPSMVLVLNRSLNVTK